MDGGTVPTTRGVRPKRGARISAAVVLAAFGAVGASQLGPGRDVPQPSQEAVQQPAPTTTATYTVTSTSEGGQVVIVRSATTH